MTPDQTTAYIREKAPAYGVDPSLALSLAELTSYAPKWTGQGRSGILQIPNEYITDIGKYQANPETQIDAGLMLLSQKAQDAPNDFGLLASYTGSPKTALKAYFRAMKYRDQSITPQELEQSVQALGLDLDPMAEARRAGLRVEEKQPEQPQGQQMPQQQQAAQTMQSMQQPEAMPEDDPMDLVMVSDPKQKKARIEAAFGSTDKDGDIPEDLIAYVKGLVK